MFGTVRSVCFLQFLIAQPFSILRLAFLRDNGYLLPDKTVPCVAPVGTNATITTAPIEEQRCVVKLGWLWIDSASFRYVLTVYLLTYS